VIHPTQDGEETFSTKWGNPDGAKLAPFPFSFRRAERRGRRTPFRTFMVRPCNEHVLSFILALSAGTTPTADPTPTFGNRDLRERAALAVRAGFAFEYSSAFCDCH
jgi:hypothetical protein